MKGGKSCEVWGLGFRAHPTAAITPTGLRTGKARGEGEAPLRVPLEVLVGIVDMCERGEGSLVLSRSLVAQISASAARSDTAVWRICEKSKQGSRASVVVAVEVVTSTLRRKRSIYALERVGTGAEVDFAITRHGLWHESRGTYLKHGLHCHI